MTNELKNLMTEAVDAQPSYVPDPDALVRTGRRQVRRRRTAAVLASLATAAMIAGATTVAVDTINRSSEVPVAPDAASPTAAKVAPAGSTGLCSKADGTPADAWTGWQLVVKTQDTFGMSIIYRSPQDPKLVVFCTTEWGDGAKRSVVPGGALHGIVLRKSAAKDRGAAPGSSVTSVFGQVSTLVDPKPRGLPRITVRTADGYQGIATVANGWFVYRRVEHSPWPGPIPHVAVGYSYPGTTVTWKVSR
ncbi:hypothetical protein [Kribbella sp. NPDC048915]|uniref:hypothetical protein n=1 Tax=Kribbella sp. NPDC048915 TaxID=3155148 RepID=UPI0033D00AF0